MEKTQMKTFELIKNIPGGGDNFILKNKQRILDLEKRKELKKRNVEIVPEQPNQPTQPPGTGLTEIDLENIYPNYDALSSSYLNVIDIDYFISIFLNNIPDTEDRKNIENYLNRFSKFIMFGNLSILTTSKGEFTLDDIYSDTYDYNDFMIVIPYPQINNNIITLLFVEIIGAYEDSFQIQIVNKGDNLTCRFCNSFKTNYVECNISTLMEILEVVLSFSNPQLTNSSNSNHINKRKLKEICNKLNIRYNKNINKTLDLIYKKINEN